MNMNIPRQSTNSFIMFQRNIPDWLFKDSKLFTLLAYCARRARRSKKETVLSEDGTTVTLDVGEFLIGRYAVERDTDLTISEYRTRWKKMQALGWVEQVQATSKYTKGKLVSSVVFDINAEENNQPMTNQRPAINQPMATNNNANNYNNVKNAAADQNPENRVQPLEVASPEKLISTAFEDYVTVRIGENGIRNPQAFKKILLKEDKSQFIDVFELMSKQRNADMEAHSDDMQLADRGARLYQAYSQKLNSYPSEMCTFVRKWFKANG